MEHPEIYSNICNEYIYLVREREHVVLQNNIYTVGKTKQNGIKRLNNYSSGSELILQLKVPNCDIMEKKIIASFKEKYEIFEGRETFIGNVESMKEDIWYLCINEKETTEQYIKRINEERIRREREQDMCLVFIRENIIRTDNKNDMISKKILQYEFSNWWHINQFQNYPKRGELFEYMSKNFGLYNRGQWRNVKFANENNLELDAIDEI